MNMLKRLSLSRIRKIVLVSTGLVAVMCTGTIAPALPQIAEHYSYINNSKLLVRLIISTPQLMIGLTSIIVGFIIKKTNKGKALVLSICMYCVFGSLCFFIENIYGIILLRAMLGITISFILSISSTLIAEIFDGKERSSAVSLQTTFMSIGTLTYSLLSGLITDKFYWRFNFLLYAGPIILVPLVIKYIYPIESDSVNILKKENENLKKQNISKIKQSNVKIAFILFICMINMISYYMIPLQLPFFLRGFESMNARYISVALAAETFAAAITAYFYSKMEKEGNPPFEVFAGMSFLLMSISYFVISITNVYLMVIFSMLIYGVGMGAMMPTLTLWIIGSTKPFNRSLTLGAMYTSLYLGKFAASFVIHFVSKLSDSIRDLYKLVSVVILLIAVILFMASFLLNYKSRCEKNL